MLNVGVQLNFARFHFGSGIPTSVHVWCSLGSWCTRICTLCNSFGKKDMLIGLVHCAVEQRFCNSFFRCTFLSTVRWQLQQQSFDILARSSFGETPEYEGGPSMHNHRQPSPVTVNVFHPRASVFITDNEAAS